MFGKRRYSPARRAPKNHRLLPRVERLEDRLTPSVSFLAVGAGDASSNDAILWTRAQDSNSTAGVPVGALVSTDPALGSGRAFRGTTDPAQDYTIHIDATGLQSGTTYYYEFLASDGTISQSGTFKTAPAPTANAPVHFGFTGDADGLMRPYGATANVTAGGIPGFAQQNFDYFVWLGDTIYETASGQGTANSSPAVIDPANSLTGALQTYWRKYREQFLPVSTGPYPGLQSFFSSTGHYTLIDNHELGNKQFINGGAPPGGPTPAGSPTGAGVDATNPANDVNTTGTYINQSQGFQALEQAYTDYQPIRVQKVKAPGDPRTDGTQQLYFAQQWGANTIFFNLDDRSYRDIRMKTPSGADDNGPRADNPGRTMLGQTQLNWFEQSLLAAQQQGTTWKIVAISSPMDQIGPIGGSFTITNADGTYSNTESDGGKSWMGAYRAERNQLLKFIADNHIDHVVFLTTDDHQGRINELGYFTDTTDPTTSAAYQASYTRVPGVFEILVGPIGATGPDLITDHSFANVLSLAQSFASHQQALGIDPIGLDPNFPGLQNVSREGDPNANTLRQPVDFYSPDTFNYAVLDVDATGQHLTVTLDGLNSYPVNTFPQPSAANPVRQILQFTIGLEAVSLTASPATATAGGTTTLTASLTDSDTGAPVAGKTVVFSLNGQVVGTAMTDDTGTATLAGVSVKGILPGAYPTGVTAQFAGDASTLHAGGSAQLVIVPATDVTDQVGVTRSDPEFNPEDHTSSLGLTITNQSAAGLSGVFAIVLTDLTPGITLQSATVMVGGQTVSLTITHDEAGNAIVNVPPSVATGLAPGQALPTITLTFANPFNSAFGFGTEVFLDPLDG
jgi:phosphodiesterase/alkaline phosphatase D-like protein